MKGGKVANLSLTLLWREAEDGPLHCMAVNHFCTDNKTLSTDAYFTADVFDFHLKPNSAKNPGAFDSFHTIYLSGDHGPHFSCLQTFFNESSFSEKYGKRLSCFFLCRYHAFNRCDGAGVVSKRLAGDLAKEDLGLVTAEDFATALNRSDYIDSVGYPFKKINKGFDVFPENLKAQGKTAPLRKFCEVHYWYSDENGAEMREPGYVRAA
mgnify:CR=1 FL=1